MTQHSIEPFSSRADWRRRAVLAVAGAVLAAAMPLAHATTYTLSDLNSSITVDPSSSSGVSSWHVDGVNQLYQQWYWGRMGSTGGESSLDNLTLLNAKASDTNFNPGNNVLALQYGNSQLQVNVSMSLQGFAAGSRMSDLATQVSFTNLTGTAETLHIFQYSDFDLSGISGNDTAVATNGNTIVQTDGGMILTDSASPTPSGWQIGLYPTLLNSLTNGTPTTLNDSGSGTTGDITYAREWDFTLNPAGSANSSSGFSLDQHITVPDPGTVLLLAAGMLGLAGANRQRSKRMNG